MQLNLRNSAPLCITWADPSLGPQQRLDRTHSTFFGPSWLPKESQRYFTILLFAFLSCSYVNAVHYADPCGQRILDMISSLISMDRSRELHYPKYFLLLFVYVTVPKRKAFEIFLFISDLEKITSRILISQSKLPNRTSNVFGISFRNSGLKYMFKCLVRPFQIGLLANFETVDSDGVILKSWLLRCCWISHGRCIPVCEQHAWESYKREESEGCMPVWYLHWWKSFLMLVCSLALTTHSRDGLG